MTDTHTAAIVGVLAAEPARWWYGSELGRQAGLTAGSFYPVLIRLADRGLLATGWEERADDQPPRHRYRLTNAGLVAAAQLSVRPSGRAALSRLRTAW